jgi:ABC-2 type transport system permease protein
MNSALMLSHWLCLRRDRLALALIFVLPLIFFSIMTVVLKQMAEPTTIATIDIGVIDYDDSATTRYIIHQLQAQKDFRIETLPSTSLAKDSGRDQRAHLLREHRLNVVAVFPAEFEKTQLAGGSAGPAIQLLEDRANPIYAGILAKMLELALRGYAQLALLAPGQPRAAAPDTELFEASSVRVERVDVFGASFGQRRNIAVAYGAAGNAVLFLLFAMAGAGATLIDEQEGGITERILVSGVSVREWLVTKWLFSTAVGFVQVATMFVWGWLVYDLELFSRLHVWGFMAMTVATALAAAALGMLLAVLCRTRMQLASVSTVLILIMSALGGSMFPRFLMSPALKTVGLFTFNAWALDGYQKVFWYEADLLALVPQLSVLLALALMFMAAAIAIGRLRATG